jgi:hypothetical protein
MFFIGLLVGCYTIMAFLFFLFLLFLSILGGKSSDLWKSFIYPVIWPVSLPLFIMCILK